MWHVAEVSVKCPRCAARFISCQLPVILDTGCRSSELRQDFKQVVQQIEPYTVATCPSCGKADWVTAFEFSDEPAVVRQPDRAAHLQFRAAALDAEREGGSSFAVGLFYLNAAWCADDVSAQPQARQYRLLAAESFRKSLADLSCPADKRVEVEYLLGELLRRAGDFDGCREHFRQAIPRLKSKYAIMARRLMKLAERQESKAVDFNSQED